MRLQNLFLICALSLLAVAGLRAASADCSEDTAVLKRIRAFLTTA